MCGTERGRRAQLTETSGPREGHGRPRHSRVSLAGRVRIFPRWPLPVAVEASGEFGGRFRRLSAVDAEAARAPCSAGADPIR